MTRKEKNKLILHIRKYITDKAKTLKLKARFAPTRRKNDLIVVKLKGKHQYSYATISYLTQPFPEIDVFILAKSCTKEASAFIITKKLTEQEIIVKERRGKLRKALGAEIKVPNQLVTEEDLHNTLFPKNL